ncbi:MAG: xanthine dehydrogenase family protein molybdopterin-binding subunit [bacterium]
MTELATTPNPTKSKTGSSLRRVEDAHLILGKGRFTDNRSAAGDLHLSFVRSYLAHAKIVNIDTDAASQSDGVVAVYTMKDLLADGVKALPIGGGFNRPDGEPMPQPEWHALANGVVRYVGEAVVAVIAETQAQAVDAAQLVEVEYEELPAVGNLAAASAPGAPLVWEEAPGNIMAQMAFGDADAVEAAFAKAHHVTKLDLTNNRLVGNAMEPRTVICEYDEKSGRRTIRLGHQHPHGLRDSLQGIFGQPLDNFRVIVEDIGGGFGVKAMTYPEDVVVIYAAGKLQKTIRWRGSRTEDFQATGHGRDQINHAELACSADGKILAMRLHNLGNLGAFPTGAGTAIPLVVGPKVSTSVYHIPAYYLVTDAYATHTAPLAAYRGAGRPEAVYLMERLMEKAASELGVDPIEMRRKNFIPVDAMPYTNPVGEVYDSGDFNTVLDLILEQADWKGFAARKAESAKQGKLRGRGLSCYIEWTGAEWSEHVRMEASGAGKFTCYSGTQAMGQGIETAYLQLLSEKMDLPLGQLNVIQGDTDRVRGLGSYGSRSLYIGGSAIHEGVLKFMEAAKKLAAENLEASPEDLVYQEGRFEVVGTNVGIGLFELALQQPEQKIEISSSTTIPVASWPNGAQVAEVEVDPETGMVKMVSLTAVDDVGNAVNPMLVAGQVHGGMAQSVGQALLERTVYDDSGQFINSTFLDYAMPRADDMPPIQTDLFREQPCRTNPLGSKGVGELGTVGATPAVVNAVLDALREHGIKHLEMPLTPQSVWAALNS